MRILHLLSVGSIGGIEILCQNIMLESNIDNRMCFLFDEGILYDNLKYLSPKVFSLKDKKMYQKKKFLLNYCIKEKIDAIIVHHEGVKPNYLFIYLFAKLHKKGIKFLRYMHCSYDKYYFSKDKNIFVRVLNKIALKVSINLSDIIVYISNFVRKSFDKEFSINEKKEIVIYNGISKKFLTAPLENIRQNDNIVFTGRLAKIKGVDLLIKAIKLVIEKNEKVKLFIVGDGIERDNLMNMVERYNLQEHVEFLGNQDNVMNWLDRSNIFVYPSIAEEGFGISVVEAMSRGCIPITFEKGGLPEIIKNNYNGYIVKEDVQELADKILEVQKKDNEEIRNQCIKTAKNFTMSKMIESICQKIENVNGEDICR